MARRHRSTGTWYHHHALPFLSIMLGLIAVMALTGMGLASVKRMDERKRQYVKLANVPPELIPFHVVCESSRVRWRRDGKWRELHLDERETTANNLAALEFMNTLAGLAETNRRLSFKGRQNTLILWIRPAGALTGKIIELEAARLPIRVGKLPLLENEEVSFGEASP